MTLDQLRLLVAQAATEVVQRHGRPLPVTLVLPLATATRVVALEDFPDEDAARTDALSVLAARQMVPANAAYFGFIAEATGPGGEDLLVVAYGARRRGTHLVAATVEADGTVSEFTAPEPLEPTAMPFLQPLQHAADMAEPPEDPGGGLPIIAPG